MSNDRGAADHFDVITYTAPQHPSQSLARNIFNDSLHISITPLPLFPIRSSLTGLRGVNYDDRLTTTRMTGWDGE